MRRILWQWFDQRLHLEPVVRVLRENLGKPVPPHVNWLFTLGAVLSILLAVQLFTGVLLMVLYKPSDSTAYQSIERIMHEVPMGWLVRSLHGWGSHLIVILACAHLLRVFVYAGYKRPREATWVLGVMLLGVIIGFGFTGYLLPWDQVAYWATVIATEAPASIPFLGPYIREFMIGGSEVGDPALGRFYVAHVFLLPLLLVVLVSLHLFLIRYQGISPLSRTDQPEPSAEELTSSGGKPFFPHHALKDFAAMYLALGLLLTLAILWPPALGLPADPLNTPVGIKPEWYFLPVYQLLKYVPEVIGIQIPPLFFLLLVLLPFLLDTAPERRPRKRLRVLAGGGVILAAIFALGLLGHLSGTTWEFMGRKYYFDMQGWPHQVEEVSPQEEGR